MPSTRRSHKLTAAAQRNWLRFVLRLLHDKGIELSKAAPFGLPYSSLKSWRTLQHRVTRGRASDILTKLGSSWHDMVRIGRASVADMVPPVQLLRSWTLASDLTIATKQVWTIKSEVSESSSTTLTDGTWLITVQEDLWCTLHNASGRCVEGYLTPHMTKEVLRVIKTKARRKRTTAVTFSSLHKRLGRVHSSKWKQP